MENIDAIVYINLDKRKDRLEEINEEFKKMDFDFSKIIRFSAIEINHIGCSLSHLEVIKFVKKHNFKNVLVLEDDFEFLVDKKELNETLNKFFKDESDFDVVMLSYNPLIYEEHSDILNKAINITTASGYIVNNHFYDKLIKNYEDALMYIRKLDIPELHYTDAYWFKLQKISKWYLFKKRIGKQRESYSDLVKKIVDYNF